MRLGPDLLRKMVNRTVHAVTVEVWLFGDERNGEIGDVLIDFEDGRGLVMGCAGDGSVLITKAGGELGVGPGTSTKRWTIPKLSGELKAVSHGDTWLKAQIDGRSLLMTNSDDQMEVAVDEMNISREINCRER